MVLRSWCLECSDDVAAVVGAGEASHMGLMKIVATGRRLVVNVTRADIPLP